MLLLAVAGSVICEVLDLEAMASGLYTLTFPLTAALWISTVKERLYAGDLWLLGTLALAAVAVIVSALRSGCFAIEGYKKPVMLAMALLYLQSVSKMRPDRMTETFCRLATTAMALFLTGAYLLLGDDAYDGAYLTFRMTNPNLAGLILAIVYLWQLYWLGDGKWPCRVLRFLLCLVLGYFLLQTRARSALIAAAAATLLWAAAMFRRKTQAFGLTGSGILVSVPGIFAAGYLMLIRLPWVRWGLTFLTGAGKGLDSRRDIWEAVCSGIAARPLLGDYFGLPAQTGASHGHNIYLEIAGSYGIPVLMGVLGLLWGYLYRSGRPCSSRRSFSALCCFAGALMLGIGESALLCGGLGIYVLFGTFLLLSRKTAEDGARVDET